MSKVNLYRVSRSEHELRRATSRTDASFSRYKRSKGKHGSTYRLRGSQDHQNARRMERLDKLGKVFLGLPGVFFLSLSRKGLRYTFLGDVQSWTAMLC